MTPEEVKAYRESQNAALAARGRLLLEVELSSSEEADELMRWLYSPSDKPMKSRLVAISWDKVAIRAEVAEALGALEKVL